MKIDQNGNWRLYAPVLPPSAEALGTVSREPGDTGALVRFAKTGRYAQINGGAIRNLDGRSVAAALGTGGRPAKLMDGRNVNVYLDAESIKTADRLGNGSISAGIRQALNHK